MFDRPQADITVIQFRGNSLPVHQSMSVSWAFTLSYFISQIRPHDLFRSLATRMCHFLPVHHFGMAWLPGPKVKIQHFDLHQVYTVPTLLNHDRVQELSYCKHSLLSLPVVGIEPATSK